MSLLWRNHVTVYVSYMSMNWTNVFGFLLVVLMAIQVLSGILLSCYYCSYFSIAFDSVWYIMFEVGYGFIIRLVHILGSMGIMSCIMIHWLRGYWLRLKSFVRFNFSWYSGFLLLFIVFLESFLGYLLVWGKMSYWGVTVMINIVSGMISSVLQFLGFFLLVGYCSVRSLLATVDNSGSSLSSYNTLFESSFETVNSEVNKLVDSVLGFVWCSIFCITSRLFVLHFLLGLIIIGLILVHLIGLHSFSGSSTLFNSSSVCIPFFPIIVLKDMFVLAPLLIIASSFILLLSLEWFESFLANVDNQVKADSVSTPSHILPEWYFLLYYCCLRCFSSKVIGVFMVVFFFALIF